MARVRSRSASSSGPQADPPKPLGRHILRSADEYPADEPVIPQNRFPSRVMPRKRGIDSDNIACTFDDTFVRTAELPAGADWSIFAAGVREAGRAYERETRQPDDNELHHEIEALYDAARRRQCDRAGAALRGLSPQALTYLEDRLQRPGPQKAGLRLPAVRDLRDPRRGEKACEMIERLCRVGGGLVEGRKRQSGGRSRPTFRPLLYAPALRRHVPKRDPERNFVMNLQTTWLEATGTKPSRTARHEDSGRALVL
jgi:hypothetical protein